LPVFTCTVYEHTLLNEFLKTHISKITSGFLIERPPGVPFQKIQFGNERGGRSVLSRLPELGIARILALLRCLILCPSV
jgi:hypothetical protein